MTDSWSCSSMVPCIILDPLKKIMLQEALLFSYESLGYLANRIRVGGLPVEFILQSV